MFENPGSLNLLEASGPKYACTEIALPYGKMTGKKKVKEGIKEY
jgi:hypothetical protein